MGDQYTTLREAGNGTYSERRSKFLSFALPVATVQDAMQAVAECQRKYYDARHVCWAYVLGPEADTCRSTDGGEPSGTAGRPIMGQIVSRGLTNVLVMVVRYFGGVKLGTGPLGVAYRTAAAAALDAAPAEVRTVDEEYDVTFPYPRLTAVMRVARDEGARILLQECGTECHLRLAIRRSRMPRLVARVSAALSPY